METVETTRNANNVQINIPYPQTGEHRLHVTVGACHLKVTPGDSETWVTGRYFGSTVALPLVITQLGGEVRIGQRQEWDELGRLFDGGPTLELELSKSMPYSLAIETGASDSDLDLGGLPLTQFTLRQGAGKIVTNFSSPNPQPMERLSIGSGASRTELFNLANANFTDMLIEGGAAAYTLDFGGALRRDAHVRMTSAMSSADISVPLATPARFDPQVMIGSCNVGEGFVKTDDGYWTEEAMKGTQPTLYVRASVTMGSVNLHSR